MRTGTLFLMAAILLVATAGGVTAGDNTANFAADNLDEAYALYTARDFEKAAPLLRQLAEDNPYNGQFWSSLGTCEYNLKNWLAAAQAYGRAAEVGYQTGGSLYNRGCSLALTGDPELMAAAIAAVEASITAGLRDRENLLRNDSDLDAIRDTEIFQTRIMPAMNPELSRQEKWRADFDYLTLRMEQSHYDVYAHITEEQWRSELQRIGDNADALEDYEIVVELMALVARVNDGHTGVRTPQGAAGFHVLPVDFYIFSDGIFVRQANEAYADAVGKRVVKVGNLPVDEVYARVATVTQRDNSQQIKWIAPRFMSVVEILDGLDITDGLEHVDIVVADANGDESTMRVNSVPLTRGMVHRDFDASVLMVDDADASKPMWRKDLEQNYWYEYIPERKLVYFNFNSVRNEDEGESIADFSAGMFEFIEHNDVDALVIDVRMNHGGNNFLIKPIINGVIASTKINSRGSLFVITGRETFSACQNFCNRMERAVNPIFVGEPTGSSPNFVGEGNLIELPYSGLVVNGSSRLWQDSVSEDRRPWIAPQLLAEMTSQDFRQNRDPSLDAIFTYLDRRSDDDSSASR